MAGTAIACAWISLPGLAFPPLAAGIALAWAWHVAQALQWSKSAVRTLELTANGSVRSQDGLGLWSEVEILPSTYVSGWLMVVILGANERRRRSLVLLRDAAAAEELRRLRVWLRWRLARS